MMNKCIIFALAIACVSSSFVEYSPSATVNRAVIRSAVPTGPAQTAPSATTDFSYLVNKLRTVVSGLTAEQINNAQMIVAEAATVTKDERIAAYLLATAYSDSNLIPVVEKLSEKPAIKAAQATYFASGYESRGFSMASGPTLGNKIVNLLKSLKVSIKDRKKDLLKPENAAKVLVHGALNGTFTARKLTEFISGKVADFVKARLALNGDNLAEIIASITQKILKA